jgi:periplasmic nitrate reductase NapD
MRLGNFVKKEQDRDHAEVENLCGVLVHARPDRMTAVTEELGRLPGVEIHAANPDGKLVVTVEDAEGQWAGSTITRFNEVAGVLSVALVYHHFDTFSEGEIVP